MKLNYNLRFWKNKGENELNQVKSSSFLKIQIFFDNNFFYLSLIIDLILIVFFIKIT